MDEFFLMQHNTVEKQHSTADHILSRLEDIHRRLDDHSEAAAGEGNGKALPSRGASSIPDLNTGLESIRSDIGALAELMRGEIENAFEKLTEAQTNATASQGAVLRTLTEAIFSASAGASLSASDLDSAMQRFEDRISATIHKALGSLAGNVQEGKPSASPSSASRKNPDATGDNTPRASAGSWDEIRRAMLNDSAELRDSDSPRTAYEDSEPERSESQAELSAGEAARSAEPEMPLEIPEPVDIESLSEAQVRETLIERDKLISSLIARLRRRSYSLTDQITTDQLRQLAAEMPDELARRVTLTLRRMDEQIRLGELEMSIERARIAREVTKLSYSRHQIEQAAQQLGWIVNPDGTIQRTTATVNKSSSSRRWLGKLGLSE